MFFPYPKEFQQQLTESNKVVFMNDDCQLIDIMNKILIRFGYARAGHYKFSNQFLKQTKTQFQQELGLTDKIKKMYQSSQKQERFATKMFGFPFVIGISALVTLILSFNSDMRKIFKYSSGVFLALLSANFCSADICQKWVLSSIHKYTQNVKTSNSPTFFYQLQFYMRRNGVDASTSSQLGKILEYGCDLVGSKILPKQKQVLIQIVELGFFNQDLKKTLGFRKASQLLLNLGNIQSQYLALLIYPDLDITDISISTLSENLKVFAKMKDIQNIPSYNFKIQLTKKQIVYILQNIKGKNIKNLQIPIEVKQIYH